MPPHDDGMQAQVPPTTIEKGTQPREQEHLSNFSEYCRLYYTHTISLGSMTEPSHNNDSAGYLENGQHNIKIDHGRLQTCEAVLEAFNSLCVLNRPLVYEDQVYNDAVARCGLLESCFSEGEKGHVRVEAYIKARDNERRKVHHEQMRARKEHFLSLLQEKEEDHCSIILSREADLCTKMKSCDRERKVKDKVREFVRGYKKMIGAHSFLAGFRKILESQHEHRFCVVYWSFDCATITENCSAGNDALMHDALSLLLSLLSRRKVEKCDEGNREAEEIAAFVTTWVLQDYVSMGLVKKVLNLLPRLKDLDTRPTGKVLITNERRNGDAYKKGVSLENWCNVL